MQTKVRNNEKYAFCDIPMFYVLEHCAYYNSAEFSK